jgi:hypothetical protein
MVLRPYSVHNQPDHASYTIVVYSPTALFRYSVGSKGAGLHYESGSYELKNQEIPIENKM